MVELGDVHVLELRAELARDHEGLDGPRAVHVDEQTHLGVVRVALLHARHLVVETRERMLARVAHGAAVAGERAVAAEVVPRLQADAAVLARIGRALVEYLARVDEHIDTGHIVVEVGLLTVLLVAYIVGHDLAAVVEREAAEAADKAGHGQVVRHAAANVEHLARLDLERAAHNLRLVVHRHVHHVAVDGQAHVVPQAVVQERAPVDHELIGLALVAQAELDDELALAEEHLDVAGVLVGRVLGKAVVVEQTVHLEGAHAEGDVEARRARIALRVQVGVAVLEGHGHLVEVDAAVGEVAALHLVVGPLVAHALEYVDDAILRVGLVDDVLDAAHEVGAYGDAAVDVRGRAAHVQLAVEVERVEEAHGLVAHDQLVNDDLDRLAVAAYLEIVPLEVVEQRAAADQRLAALLHRRAEVDTHEYAAVAQLDRHVVVVLRALAVEEERARVVGAKA